MSRPSRLVDRLGRLPGWRLPPSVRPDGDGRATPSVASARVGGQVGRLATAHVVASYPASLVMTALIAGWLDPSEWVATALAPATLPLIAVMVSIDRGRTVVTRVDWVIVAAAYLIVFVVALRLLHAQSRARQSAGQCAACGYDLRATPDRCPECGATTA